MAKVELYYRDFCGFCARAETLLSSKGVDYVRYNIWEEDGRQKEMVERSGGKTSVPQVFIDDQHIGGSDDLAALERNGGLDPLLKA